MPHITRDSLMTLESYAKAREGFRSRIMEHKKSRHLRIGPNVTLIFEDELTIRYQIQEMLRVERIFEEREIEDELATYNPLVPDGRNWKATMMIEYPDIDLRRQMLEKLVGIENKVWVKVEGHQRIYAIADEDLERENAEKTSSVHFLRFELDEATVRSLRRGAPLSVGIDHPQYNVLVEDVDPAIRESLLGDLV